MKSHLNLIKYLLITLAFIIIVKLLQYFFLLPFIEQAFNGDSIHYLNELIARHSAKNPEVRTLDYYLAEAPRYINRLLFLFLLFISMCFILLKDNALKFKNFFYSEEPGISLAILRITVVSIILFSGFPSKLNAVLTLGPDNIYPPPGWSKMVIELLIENPLLPYIEVFFIVFLIGGLLGIYTNYMLIGAVITGFFVMGIPQFFGKIDHYHILWYSLLIVSVSNSGNSLSVDNWIRRSPQINHDKAIQFGIPLKIIMILIGITYLFPGVWKITFSGLEWAFSDNLKYKLYSKWIELPGWTPFFRIDKYPLLYQGSALITLIVEIGFIFALFFKKIRPYFIFAALSFHFFVFIFLKISFLGHVLLYTVFINWSKVFERVSNLIGGKHSVTRNILPVDTSRVRYQSIIGTLLIIGSSVSGGLLIDSWPFGVYPTFASIEHETIPSISIIIEEEQTGIKRNITPLTSQNFVKVFDSVGRLRKETERLYRAGSVDQDQVQEFIDVIEKDFLSSKGNYSIYFYKVRLLTNPDILEKTKSTEELLIQVDLTY